MLQLKQSLFLEDGKKSQSSNKSSTENRKTRMTLKNESQKAIIFYKSLKTIIIRVINIKLLAFMSAVPKILLVKSIKKRF